MRTANNSFASPEQVETSTVTVVDPVAQHFASSPLLGPGLDCLSQCSRASRQRGESGIRYKSPFRRLLGKRLLVLKEFEILSL